MENKCEDYSPYIYIPGKSDPTASLDTTTQSYFITICNAQYQNISNHSMWYELQLPSLTEKE